MKYVKPLSWREVCAIKKAGLHAVGGAVGLYLLVKPSGFKYYVYRYKSQDGRRSMISIAPVSDIGLAEAREKAKEWKERVRSGENPSIVKKQRAEELKAKAEEVIRQREEEQRTFSYVADLWLKEQVKGNFWKKNERGETHAIHFLKNYLNPAFGKKPMAELNVHDVFNMIRPIYQNHFSTSNKILNLCSSIWDWAEVKGWTTGSNPAKKSGSLRVLLAPYRNDRDLGKNYAALSIEDVPEFFKWMKRIDSDTALLTEFQILTATRSKMARYIKWEDVNFEEGTVFVPESSLKTKNRGNHTIYLSKQAMDIIKSMPRMSEYVFASRKGTAFCDAVTGAVIRRINEMREARGLPIFVDREQTKEEGYDVVITTHGTARASFKTWTKSGENRKLLDEEAVELCLAHGLKDDYDGAYNRAHLAQERRDVMQQWADYCYSKI